MDTNKRVTKADGLITSNHEQDQSPQKQPKKKPGKIKQCPNCGMDWKSGYLGWYGYYNGVYCANCKWNQIPTTWRVTKERYEYWYRLYRIRMRPHQVYPPKWKQPLDIIMESIHHTYAKTVPAWMQTHFDETHFWSKIKVAHHWIFQSKSRWEYHLKLRDGEVKDWAEYQAMYKARRQWEADNTDYSDYYDEPEY